MKGKIGSLLLFLFMLALPSFGQIYGGTWMEVDGPNYEAYTTYDSTGLPPYVQICKPQCTTYWTQVHVTVTIKTPTNRTASGQASGIGILTPEAVLAINNENTNILVTTDFNYNCGQQYVSGFFNNYFEIAWSRMKFTGVTTNCRNQGGVPVCDYHLTSWCTPATTPPDYNPPFQDDLEGWTQPTYTDVMGLCVRVLPTEPWFCGVGIGFIVNHINMPKFTCTKNN